MEPKIEPFKIEGLNEEEYKNEVIQQRGLLVSLLIGWYKGYERYGVVRTSSVKEAQRITNTFRYLTQKNPEYKIRVNQRRKNVYIMKLGGENDAKGL